MLLKEKHLVAWEKDYKKRGATWRGTTNFQLALAARSRVLEIGCGNGKNLSSLSRQGFELNAIDSSPSALKLSAELLSRVGGSAQLKQMDARALDYPNDFFDAVICFHTLGHLLKKERLQAAKEAERVLRKGGKLYFREFAEGDMREGKGEQVIGEERSWQRGNGILYHYFTEAEVHALFKGERCASIEIEKWNVFYKGKKFERKRINAVFEK